MTFSETTESHREWNDIQCAKRKKTANQKFYIQQNYPTKKKEGKIKTLPDKHRQKEFTISKPGLQKKIISNQ